jgi:hypothetical protein
VLDSVLDASGAQNACGALGETLWTPKTSDFLPYLAYQDVKGPFWVDGGCACFDNDGIPQWEECPDTAPALCTSSAPLSNSTHQDNSTQWQVRVNTGDHCFTGYVGVVSQFRMLEVRLDGLARALTIALTCSM